MDYYSGLVPGLTSAFGVCEEGIMRMRIEYYHWSKAKTAVWKRVKIVVENYSLSFGFG